MPRYKFCVSCLTLLLSHSIANALCLDGRNTSVPEEFKNSAAIIIGIVERERALTQDESDPSGVTATLYTVKVVRKLKGKVKDVVHIFSDNTSSRFLIESKAKYVLFLTQDGANFVIDSCGNSGQMSTHGDVVAEVRRIALKK